jgi:hypothetical protein
LQRSPCRLKGKEAHPWFDSPVDKAVILLDKGIEIVDQVFRSTASASMPLALRSAIALE